MLCRITERRGLHDTNGNTLPDDTIRAAWYGSAIDGDICHLSVRDMLYNMCNRSIVLMVREFDLENGIWLTDSYDECGRYADDILCDWRTHGSFTYRSLHDIACMYVHQINSCAKPDRQFGESDFAYTHEYGTMPNTIPEPTRPAAYRIGEGHTTTPDGVGHPLIEHVAHCTPHGLIPHKYSGCAYRAPDTHNIAMAAPLRHTPPQQAKEESIQDMVHALDPDAAYVLGRNGRHDIVLYGGVDTSEALRLADAIQIRHGTPVGCIVLRSDDLLCDRQGNDAKHIIRHGIPMAGMLHVQDPVEPPRPADVTKHQLIWNLDRLGFPMCVRDPPGWQKIIRPEYVVTASQFHTEPRWFLSGTALLLRRSDMDWDLMAYLARTYRFAGLVCGILKALEDVDGNGTYQEPLSVLGAGPSILNEAEKQEATSLVTRPSRQRHAAHTSAQGAYGHHQDCHS